MRKEAKAPKLRTKQLTVSIYPIEVALNKTPFTTLASIPPTLPTLAVKPREKDRTLSGKLSLLTAPKEFHAAALKQWKLAPTTTLVFLYLFTAAKRANERLAKNKLQKRSFFAPNFLTRNIDPIFPGAPESTKIKDGK